MDNLVNVLISQFGPVAILLVFAAYGLHALSRYGKEIGRIRDRADEQAAALRNEQLVGFQTMREDIAIVAKLELAKVMKDEQAAQQEKIARWSEDADAVVQKLARYDFLREYRHAEAAVELGRDRIGSLEKAHRIVQQLFSDATSLERTATTNERDRTRRDSLQAEALDLVRSVIEHKISGDHDDYHNMAAELATQDFPQYALDILEEGMRRFPESPDLIGSAMQYAVNNGNMEKAQDYFQLLGNMDPSRWNWRAFTFAVKYQVVKGDEAAAEALHRRAIERLPDDERPSVQYAELFERRGQTAQAIEILEGVIGRTPTAPQAGLKLAEFYKNQGRYREAVAMGRKALAMDALNQSRANNAAIHLTIGLAGEQLWIESLRPADENPEQSGKDGASATLLREFLTHYAAALGTPDRPPFVRGAIEMRKATVQGYLLAQGYSKDGVRRIFDEVGLDSLEKQVAVPPEFIAALMNRFRSSSGEGPEE